MQEIASFWPRSRDQWIRVLFLAALYFVLGRLSFALAVVHGTVTNVVFASEGVALAFALRHGVSVWPGIFAGQLALALSTGLPPAPALAIALVNSLEALLGVWLFRRAGLHADLQRLRDCVGLFVLSAGVLQPFSATFGTLALRASDLLSLTQWPTAWLAWWTGNVMGQVLFTSLLLAWAADSSWHSRRAFSARLIGTVLLGGVLIAVLSLFVMRHPVMAFALCYPVVAWVAIQWGPRGSTLVTAILCVTATALAAHGLPPFSESALLDRIFLLDLFILSTALTSMIVAAMVAQYRRSELLLRASEERMALAFAATQDGVWDWNLQTEEIYYSPRWKQMLGYRDDEIVSSVSEWERLLHPDDREHALKAVEAVRASGQTYQVEFRLRHKAGHYVPILSRGYPLRPADGGPPVRFVGTHFELTERKRQQAALIAAHDELEARVARRTEELTRANAALQAEVMQRQQAEEWLFAEKERAQITLASIGDGVITTNPQGLIETMNGIAQRLVGVSQELARDRPFAEVFRVVNEIDREPIPDPVAAVLKSGQIRGFEGPVILQRPDGTEVFISDSAAPIRDLRSRIVGTVIVFRDVTAEQQLARAVSYQASHDALTGTLNRAEFERRLGLMLEHVRTDGHQHAICYLDLDEFKVVNDTCGHGAGDELLRQITSLLKTRLRERDTLARLGGDEFGILLGNCPLDEAARIAHELRERVHQFRFAWEDKTFTIGVSIGLVPINESSLDVAGLLSQADGACYIAKENGRNRVHLHQPGDKELEHRRSQMRWIDRLEKAREENRLCLYYQPIAPLNGARPGSSFGEVLLRFVDEGGDVMLPSVFIPAAERYHQMLAIDRWVVQNLFTALSRESGSAAHDRYAVNLSGQSLGNRDFLDYVIQQFDVYGVAPERICFEITETAAIAKLDSASLFIVTLKARGCAFALDDFGSGLSSFGYLQALPVDYLKIDGSFVRQMVADPVNHATVEAIHRIGSVMGLKTVGEWVEDLATLSSLREAGVDFAQGYAIGAPRPLMLN